MSESWSGVVFDLDGTLVDSLGDIVASLNHVLAASGYPTHSPDQIAGMVGEGAAALVSRAVPPGGDVTGVLLRLRDHYGAHALDTTRLFPGVEALLAQLVAAEIPVAVLSNKPHVMTLAMVDALVPDGPFFAVVGQREGIPKKPDPTVVLQLLQQVGAPPSRCVMVGDTAIDIETGHNAGMHTVAVTWGFRSATQLRLANPDTIVDTIDELAQALLR